MSSAWWRVGGFGVLWSAAWRPLLPLVLVLMSLACGSQLPERSIDRVFLITIDTLRADHLSSYGYGRETSPRLDELARSGVLFERAIAQWPKTGASFASMFVGQYPQTTGLTHKAATKIPDSYLTLPEFFASLGFTTVGVVSNPVLSAELGWDAGFDAFVETWSELGETGDPVETRRQIDARRVNELALPLIEEHRDQERLFAWVHYVDPHTPYILPEGVENPFIGDDLYLDEGLIDLRKAGYRAIGERRERSFYTAQYDANIRVTDRAIGDLLDRLRVLGLLERSLVIVTADHGEGLGEHGLDIQHGPLPYNDTAHVPLIILGPGWLAGHRVEQVVELVDLYPTLVELLSPDRPLPGLEGRSLVRQLLAEPEKGVAQEARYAFSEAGGLRRLRHYRSVQDERWKLIYHPALKNRRRGSQPATWELYDLREDRNEQVDLAAQNPDQMRRLQRALSGWMKGRNWLRRPRQQVEEQSEQTLRALRALGYLE